MSLISVNFQFVTGSQLSRAGLLDLVSAQAYHMAKQRVGVEHSPSVLEPVRGEAVLPDRVLYLPTFSHFLIVNKTSLSLLRSLSEDAKLPARRLSSFVVHHL